MARTRSKPAKPTPKESSPEPTVSTAKPLPPSTSNPPKLFVLPKDASKDARIVTLDNPANNTPSRYFFCPQKGFYEFTRIVAPKKDCRSWLITGEEGKDEETTKDYDVRIGSGYITKSADLFLATPIDTLFLILPVFAPQSQKDARQHFLVLDDYLDLLSSSARHWKSLLSQHDSLKAMIEKRMRAFCDTLDVGGETMYRISYEKLLSVVMSKAERVVKNGLPRSLEEKFVQSALEVPVMNIRREDSSLSVVSATEIAVAEDSQDPAAVTTDSQTTTSTAIPADSQTTISDSQTTNSTTLTTPDLPSTPALLTPPSIPPLLRLRTALTYLTTSYIPSTLRTPLHEALDTTFPFTALDTHLTALAKLKAEAAALRSISDNISRKRAIEDDEDKIAEREEKKRKKEEEDKKKKAEGRGIKQLKKVDTSGMKKMSSFFQKVAKKA